MKSSLVIPKYGVIPPTTSVFTYRYSAVYLKKKDGHYKVWFAENYGWSCSSFREAWNKMEAHAVNWGEKKNEKFVIYLKVQGNF